MELGRKLTKADIGKAFKTKDGRKAIVTGIKLEGMIVLDDAFTGKVQGWSQIECWADTGIPIEGSGCTSLVAEWVEPTRIRGWINIYRVGMRHHAGPTLFASKADADHAASEDAGHRSACIEIDVLEGSGLEGEVRS